MHVVRRVPFTVEPDRAVDAGLVLIGRAIRSARRANHMTQAQLARQAGLSQAAISRLETGKLNGMRLRRLARVVACLNGFRVDV